MGLQLGSLDFIHFSLPTIILQWQLMQFFWLYYLDTKYFMLNRLFITFASFSFSIFSKVGSTVQTLFARFIYDWYATKYKWSMNLLIWHCLNYRIGQVFYPFVIQLADSSHSDLLMTSDIDDHLWQSHCNILC